MQPTTQTDSLRKKIREWLEVIADNQSVDAHRRYLAADVAGAEQLLLSALELVPGSKNIGQKLGRMYFDSGDQQRGLAYLEELGMVSRARPLSRPPDIDGDLDDPVWQEVEPLSEFYQCIFLLASRPAECRAEAYIGYVGQTLYFAVKGYESDTAGLVAEATDRDSDGIYRDDCVEIYFYINRDAQSFYQFIINSLGTIADDDDGTGGEWRSWSTQVEAATTVADTFWSVEVAIAVGGLKGASFAPGDIWGFNIARVRIGNASEFAQWVPTYGYSHRPDRFGYLLFE